MSTVSDREFGAFEARLDNLERVTRETQADVKSILAEIATVRGAWKGASWLAAAIGAVVGAIATVISKIGLGVTGLK